jgi:hypothetical protein
MTFAMSLNADVFMGGVYAGGGREQAVQNRTPFSLSFVVSLPSVEATGRWRERGGWAGGRSFSYSAPQPTEWFRHVEVGWGLGKDGMPALGVGRRRARWAFDPLGLRWAGEAWGRIRQSHP